MEPTDDYLVQPDSKGLEFTLTSPIEDIEQDYGADPEPLDLPVKPRNRPHLVHTVSIVIESADIDARQREECTTELEVVEKPPKDDVVQSIMDDARLRKEEFARLLEEHAQIVKEINKAENSFQ